eukprot:UN05812
MASNRLKHILSHLYPNDSNASMMEYVFITGCSRGIGYGLVEQFLNQNNIANDNKYFVIATCRSPNNATKLKSLFSQHPNTSKLIKLDTSNEDSIINALQQISDNKMKVDILINNAAIAASVLLEGHHQETVVNFSKDELMNILKVNLVGPAL